jgi:hypothetical protein
MSKPNLSPSAIIEAVIADAIDTDQGNDSLGEFSETDATFQSVRTFEDAGVLTTDRGLVIRLSNGQEFQITIVQSR